MADDIGQNPPADDGEMLHPDHEAQGSETRRHLDQAVDGRLGLSVHDDLVVEDELSDLATVAGWVSTLSDEEWETVGALADERQVHPAPSPPLAIPPDGFHISQAGWRHARRSGGRVRAPQVTRSIVAALVAVVVVLGGAVLVRWTGIGTGSQPPSPAPVSAKLTRVGGAVVLTPGGSQSRPAGAQAVTCLSDTACVVVANGSDGAFTGWTSDGGVTWTEQVAPGQITELAALSCPSASACTAVGRTGSGEGAIIATVDGGRSWSADAAPSGIASLQAVSCPSLSVCVATGTPISGAGPAVVITSDGGRRWVDTADPSGLATIGTVSCLTATTCLVTGEPGPALDEGSGVTSISMDGGQSWSTPAGTNGVAKPQWASCPNASTCYVVGTNNAGGMLGIATSADGGGMWQNDDPPGRGLTTGGIIGLSCSGADCPTVSNSVASTVLDVVSNGNSGSVGGPISTVLSCSTATSCWVIQAAGAGFAAQPVGTAVTLPSG